MHMFDNINDEMWLTLLWSLWLMSPWKAYFLMCRTMPNGQVPFGPVHMRRWLVRTSMGLKSPSDGCWDPVRGAETGQCLTEVLHRRRRGRFTRGTLAEPDLGGMTPFQWNASLGRLRTSPSSPWRHPTSWSFLEADWAAVARVACWRSPLGANVLLLDVSPTLKGASTSLEGDFTFITAQLGF